jgi:murein DD-endopeptidase MepM/ murein hydrolase activator NlpD
MKKIKYHYNTQTLRFEKIVTPFRVKLLRTLGVISGILVASSVIIYFYLRFFPQPGNLEYKQKYQWLAEQYNELENQLQTVQDQVEELETRDKEVYRSIFEANPLPDSTKSKKSRRKKKRDQPVEVNTSILASGIQAKLMDINKRISHQQKSYEQILGLIKDQSQKLSSLPAIQPVSNKKLNRIASGFGMRIDPVYGTPKMHKGLDFTAPTGTPIYATGNGRVRMAGFSEGGYGNHVVIDHGYGYQTLYGHMFRIKVRAGQFVKRGETIGWVGNTGKSTGPHCHYEVVINGHQVDPVFFFYNDLNADEYDRILKIAKIGSAKSFD